MRYVYTDYRQPQAPLAYPGSACLLSIQTQKDWKSTFVSGPLTALKVKAKGMLQAESENLSFSTKEWRSGKYFFGLSFGRKDHTCF